MEPMRGVESSAAGAGEGEGGEYRWDEHGLVPDLPLAERRRLVQKLEDASRCVVAGGASAGPLAGGPRSRNRNSISNDISNGSCSTRGREEEEWELSRVRAAFVDFFVTLVGHLFLDDLEVDTPREATTSATLRAEDEDALHQTFFAFFLKVRVRVP